MDYENRQIKWYWLVLFVAYCGAVVYLLFSANPYLYSHHELRSAMSRGEALDFFSFPKEPATGLVGNPTFFERFDSGHTGIDPLGSPRSKNYAEYQQFPVEFGLEGFTPQSLAQDQSGFYLTGKSPWILAVGLDGQVRWKFKLKDLKDDKFTPALLVDEAAVYAIHPQGEVLSLNKADGRVRWLISLERGLIAQPFFWRSRIIFPAKGTKSPEWISIQRVDGKISEKIMAMDIKPGFVVSNSAGGKSLIVVVDNKIMSVDPDKGKIEWTQTVTDPIRGTATVVDNSIYVATLGSKLIKLDAGKKGKIEWDLELAKSPVSPPTYVPVASRLAVMLNDAQLVMVDAKTGKQLWNYNTLNKSGLIDPWAVRISAKHIEEYKMDWLHKGWTVWSACSNRHFCMFTPNKGQLIQSTPLSAEPWTLPLQIEKHWVFFGRTKDDKYLVSHMLEASEIKKLRQEAAAKETGQ